MESDVRRRAVLVVDDDVKVARAWRRRLRLEGWRTLHAGTLAKAKRIATSSAAFDAVLLDLRLPDGDGASLIPLLSRRQPPTGVVVVSGALDAQRATRLRGRVDLSLPKPAEPSVVVEALAGVCRRDDEDAQALAAFAARHRLSPKETRLLEMALLTAMSGEEMADELGCVEGTLTSYWKRIYAKTRCPARWAVTRTFWRFRRTWRRPEENT